MMRKHFVMLTALLLTGCGVIQPRPIIEKRFATYRSEDGSTLPSEQPLRLSVTSADPDAPNRAIKLTDLGDRAQAALITANNGKPPTSIKPKSAGANSVEIRTDRSRVLVVSAVPLKFMEPGDRIDAMHVSLHVDQSKSPNWHIISWDVAVRDGKVIKIGSLTDEASSKVSASTGLGLGPLLPSATVGAEASHSTRSEMDVTDPSTLDAAVDADGTAWILLSGGWRDNLAHNSALEVQIAFDGGMIEERYVSALKLFEDAGDDEGKSIVPAKVKLTETRVIVPGNRKAVCGTANITYRVRSIKLGRGRTTFSEADDDVIFSTYKGPNVPFFLAPPSDTAFYIVEVASQPLKYTMSKDGLPNDLKFGSREDASQFISWLQTTSFAGTDLGIGSIGLVGADGRSLVPMAKSQLKTLAISFTPPSASALDCTK